MEIMILRERVLSQKDKYYVCYAVIGTEYRSPASTPKVAWKHVLWPKC